jgi:hypothetical protein
VKPLVLRMEDLLFSRDVKRNGALMLSSHTV